MNKVKAVDNPKRRGTAMCKAYGTFICLLIVSLIPAPIVSCATPGHNAKPQSHNAAMNTKWAEETLSGFVSGSSIFDWVYMDPFSVTRKRPEDLTVHGEGKVFSTDIYFRRVQWADGADAQRVLTIAHYQFRADGRGLASPPATEPPTLAVSCGSLPLGTPGAMVVASSMERLCAQQVCLSLANQLLSMDILGHPRQGALFVRAIPNCRPEDSVDVVFALRDSTSADSNTGESYVQKAVFSVQNGFSHVLSPDQWSETRVEQPAASSTSPAANNTVREAAGIATYDGSKVLSSYGPVKEAYAKLQDELLPLQRELDTLSGSIERMKGDYEKKKDTLDESEQKKLEVRIRSEYAKYQEMLRGNQSYIDKKEEAIVAPVIRDLETVAETVGKSMGFNSVVRLRTDGSKMDGSKAVGTDITENVIEHFCVGGRETVAVPAASHAVLASGWGPSEGNTLELRFSDEAGNEVLGKIHKPIFWELNTEKSPKFEEWDESAEFSIRDKDGKEYALPNGEIKKRIIEVNRAFAPAGRLRGNCMDLVTTPTHIETQAPQRAHVRHILVAVAETDSPEVKKTKLVKAEDIRRQLLNGADFFETARKFSDCPSKAQGGDLGVFTKGVMVKPFEDAAFTQNAGEIGPVVETVYGYHIIQVLDDTGQPEPELGGQQTITQTPNIAGDIPPDMQTMSMHAIPDLLASDASGTIGIIENRKTATPSQDGSNVKQQQVFDMLSIEGVEQYNSEAQDMRDKIASDTLDSAHFEGTLTLRGRKFNIWGGMVATRGDSKVPCMLIQGFPFPPSPLKTDGELPPGTPIRIESYDKERKELQPASDSWVPVIEPTSNNNEPTALAHAVNVLWQFTKSGITFEADGATYKTEKADATISFTKDGVKMEGIRKIK